MSCPGVLLAILWVLLCVSCQPGRNIGEDATFTECEDIDQTVEYCAAELLTWQYDASADVVRFENTRAFLNCCGRRDIEAWEMDDGSYELRERDRPEKLGGRCNCMCVFDFGISIPSPPDTLDVRLLRKVTEEDDGPRELWSGTIELADESGEIVLDDEPLEGWCGG